MTHRGEGRHFGAVLRQRKFQLERHACTELSAPRFDGNAVPLGRVVNFSEIASPKRLAWNAEARMVQGVHPV